MNQASPLVLMYHGVDPGDGRYVGACSGLMGYVLKRDEFLRHLEALEGAGRRVVDPVAFLSGSVVLEPGDVLLTFDDGDRSDYDVVFPILQKKGWRALFFVTAGFVGQSGQTGWEQWREMGGQGMALGAHGLSHRFLTAMSREEQRYEFIESRKRIEGETGFEVRSFSFPGGRFNRQALEEAAAAGYEKVFTSIPGSQKTSGQIQVIGRVAVRATMTGDRLRDFLDHQEVRLRELRWIDRVRRLAQGVLGERLYPEAHRFFWRLLRK
ncbi:MAG TPA: polysaccharide deacetylase family protein [Candidatus Sumerlaeota bacterium]|nr:polysaccharide deacetylase family protein [Candidatus Sumerlaeota bacterium]HPS01532.1 polysaccharide deacetylase family protein [Candidatus Sumerlaeota bacterium]